MKMKNKNLLAIILLFILIMPLMSLSGCKKDNKLYVPDTLDGFNDEDVRIGVVKGFVFEDIAREHYPKAQIILFDTREDSYKALTTGAVSAVMDDDAVIRARMRSSAAYTMMDGYVENCDYGMIFPPNEEGENLRTQFNTYLASQKENGNLQILDDKWFGESTDNKVTSYDFISGTNGTISLAYSNDNIPFSYRSAGKPVGYELDLIAGFCREYGYSLEAEMVSFEDVLNGVSEGKYDMGCSGFTITEERAKRMLFSDSTYSGGVALCINSDAELMNNKGSFFTEFKKKFYRTFVEDQRYVIFSEGLSVTLAIIAMTVIIGSPLGLFLYILSRKAPLVIALLTRGFVWLIYRIPAVLLVIAIYYAYWKDLAIGGIIASGIGFAICFAEEVYRMLERYASRVKGGRLEKQFILGYKNNEDFLDELVKECGKPMLESYKERIVSVIKMSAVVGYVGTVDLTKAMDLIRSKSLEIILPFIAVTICYILIIELVVRIMKKWK